MLLTDNQKTKQINNSKNITSFAKEVTTSFNFHYKHFMQNSSFIVDIWILKHKLILSFDFYFTTKNEYWVEGILLLPVPRGLVETFVSL